VNGSPGLESRPLGSSRITLFSASGNSLGGPPLALPDEVTGSAAKNQMFWSSENGGRPILALLTPIKVLKSPSVLAVWTEATYIRELSTTVRGVVTAVTVLLILAALLGGYVIASIGLRPLVTVARQATKLDEHHLEPLSYNGPRDELGLLTTTLNQMVLRLKRAFDAQKTFLAETSHELRTPLTALQGYLRIAAREATPDQKPVLEDAQRVTDAMTRLVGDLLQLSRGEVVREWVPHVVDLGEVARNVTREFGDVNITARDGLELIGDPDRLAQLVRNLVSNAVRAAGKPQGVHLVIKRVHDKLELHVKDDGPGIPELVLPRIFEKFYKGPGGGAGLGLAIVAQIARVHGGEITASNDPGGGAHFTVTLPALQDDD
jgi:two-component system, OmpR family, sensor kinase